MLLKNLFLSISAISAVSPYIYAASINTDELQRGYFDRPYIRYEAEPGECSGDHEFLLPPVPYSQIPIQAEASNLTAAQLSSKGDNVEWALKADANALTIRFSLPDAVDGSGTRQVLAVFDGDTRLAEVTLDSYWAWQYSVKAYAAEKYPDNTPASTKFARMRFDEISVLLPSVIPAGNKLRIVRESDSTDPMIIDFVEAEMAPAPVRFADIEDENKVEYTGDGSDLPAFVNKNGGKTIFIGEGTYKVPNFIEIKTDGTRITGAGMWHTNLYFSASPTNNRTYNRRGIRCSRNNCGVDNLSMNTLNNQRYFENNPANQVGKGFEGSWGSDSRIENVRVEHFECGAWIADYSGNSSKNLKVTGCRFRNNYADGINLCSGTTDAVVSHCSFRNNGDDDMASWSTGNATGGNEFSYCTAENNWRASSLAFFGGKGNKAHHIHISDGMEAGVRVTADFQGTGFDADYTTSLSDITIERCGTPAGATGTLGDFWGNTEPSLMIQPGYWYDINNLDIRRVDIYGSRGQGITMRSSGNKHLNGLELHDILISGITADDWAIFMQPALVGSGHYSNLRCEGIEEPAISGIPARFDFTDVSSISETGYPDALNFRVGDGGIYLSEVAGQVTFYDVAGREVTAQTVSGDCFIPLPSGLYVVCATGFSPVKICIGN